MRLGNVLNAAAVLVQTLAMPLDALLEALDSIDAAQVL